jgi:hypothetical protein
MLVVVVGEAWSRMYIKLTYMHLYVHQAYTDHGPAIKDELIVLKPLIPISDQLRISPVAISLVCI